LGVVFVSVGPAAQDECFEDLSEQNLVLSEYFLVLSEQF